MRQEILCLDFDGVIHSYTSGWKGASIVPDPPVDGALDFIENAVDSFDVQIFSSRSNQIGGIDGMKLWLRTQYYKHGASEEETDKIMSRIKWPQEKPPAKVSIDDRAITFEGSWPDIEMLKSFQPWNKKLQG